jgi:hypothetical protein
LCVQKAAKSIPVVEVEAFPSMIGLVFSWVNKKLEMKIRLQNSMDQNLTFAA